MEPDTTQRSEHINYYSYETHKPTFLQPILAFHNLKESLGRLDTVVEEIDQNISCKTSSKSDQYINADKTTAREIIISFNEQSQDPTYTDQHLDSFLTCSDMNKVSWLTNGYGKEVRIGLRKDVYPDSHPARFSGFYDSHRKETSNRRFSVPESQILFHQDSYKTDVLSLGCSTDMYTLSVPCVKSPETEHPHQLASQSVCYAGTEAGVFTSSCNQREYGIDLVIPITKQSDSVSNHSGKVLMQTHF